MNVEEVELIFQRLENAIKHYVSSDLSNRVLIESEAHKKRLELQLSESQLKLLQMQNIIKETVRYLDNIIIDINKTLKC